MRSTDSAVRRAVVTGASRGIGRAMALGLAKKGYTVYAMARTVEALEELAALGTPGRIHAVPLDIATPDLTVLDRALSGITGPLVALIHVAGVITTGSLAIVSEEDMVQTLMVNAVAPVRLTRRLLPLLTGNSSTILFVNSTQGLSASGGTGAYAASKHALRAATDALRSDLSGHGIRVTSLYPGRTATPMQESLYAERGEPYWPELLLQPDTLADLVHAVIALPPEAEVTDLSVRPVATSY